MVAAGVPPKNETMTTVMCPQALIDELDRIASDDGVSRASIIRESLQNYVKHYPSVKRAKDIEEALQSGDLDELKRLQGDDTDAEWGARLGLAERTWRAYRLGQTAGTAVLRYAAEKAS